jgi:cell division protein FtsI (penicillin-binding protein 3)
VPTRTVFADPSAIVDPIATARALAGILQITPEEEIALAEKLQSKGSFVFISRQAPQEIADAMLALQLPGISSYREPSRAITSEGLRALVGRTDPDGVGIAGLEILFNDTLTGVDGKSIREVNSKGQSIATGVDQSTEAIAGSDLVTTIDRNIQFQVDTILTQQTARLGAKSGTAIVMDSKTGEIYAILCGFWKLRGGRGLRAGLGGKSVQHFSRTERRNSRDQLDIQSPWGTSVFQRH